MSREELVKQGFVKKEIIDEGVEYKMYSFVKDDMTYKECWHFDVLYIGNDRFEFKHNQPIEDLILTIRDKKLSDLLDKL